MKHLMFVAVFVSLLVSVSSFAGEGKKACSAGTQACLDKMANKVANLSYDGIWVSGIGENKQITVTDVDPESPGAKADIRKGDILQTMNGTELATLTTEVFNQLMTSVKIGEQVTYAVIRDGKTATVQCTMAALPKKEMATMVGQHMISHAAGQKDQVATY